MLGSRYRDGCLIDSVALRRTEITKAAEILRGRTDWTSRGIYSGGAVTVNAVDLTRIDVAILSGFCPNGEYIESVSAYYSLLLDSYALNDVNLLCFIYTETDAAHQPHETDGLTYASAANAAYRVRIYSEANFALLPQTDPNLGNDAQDRALIVAKISANGPGVAITLSNIQSPTVYTNLLYALPRVTATITGVSILGVSSDTVTGSGLLEHYCAAGPNQWLRWASNGSTHPLALPPGNGWVLIPADGNYTLQSTGTDYITTQVILSQLPTTIAFGPPFLGETITIYNLYEQDIPRLTAEDVLHRNYIGTGVVTPENCHGLALSDISDSDLGQLEEHQDLQHSGGFIKDSSASFLQGTVSFPLAGDQLNITPGVGVDSYYVNGKKLSGCTPTSFMFLPATIPSSASGTHFYEVSISDDETSAVNLKASYDETFLPRTITGTWIVDMSENYPAGAYNLSVTGMAVGPDISYSFSWDGGETVAVTADAGGLNDSHAIRLYAADSSQWIDLWVNLNDVVPVADGTLPGVGVFTDSIIVYASLDWTQNLQTASLCGWWNAGGAPARFQIGYPPYAVAIRGVTDKRKWGTLDTTRMSESALQEIAYSPQDELHYSGVLYRRHTTDSDFATYLPVGLDVSVRGGAYYTRGKRVEFAGDTVTLYNNATNMLYLDPAGTIHVINVTSDFAGVVLDALKYVVGLTKLTPYDSVVYHSTDELDSPERGVALYAIVTAGGAIISYTNVMRNINGPVDPWSVASFSTSTLAAFDSLYTAFLYADIYSSLDMGIEIRLTGLSYIRATVIQPANVMVRGKRNSTTTNVSIGVVDASGAWQLSSGCTVKDAIINLTADGGVAIGLHNNVTIEGCVYNTGAATNDVFLFGGAAYHNVHIRDNSVYTRSSFVTATNTGNYDWWVEDNTVLQAANAIVSGIIDVSGKEIFVKNNRITTDNSATATTAINGTLSGAYVIDGNTIYLGSSADAAFNYGIYLLGHSGEEAKIVNNTIQRAAASVSHVGLGVYLLSLCANISNNTFIEMGGGVWVRSDDLVNVHIKNNTFKDTYHYGVRVSDITDLTSMDGVFICGNSFNGMTKNAGGSGVGLFGTSLYGIYALGSLDSNIYCGNFVIADNTFSLLASSLGTVYGVYCSYTSDSSGGALTAGWEGFTIDRNNFKIIGSTNGSAYGINFQLSAPNGGNPSTLTHRGISISGNSVREVASTTSHAFGIHASFDLHNTHTNTLLNGLMVNNNNVSSFAGLSGAPTLATTAGIHIENEDNIDQVVSSSCSNNTIGTTSVAIIAPGTDNDATFVYGIYNNLTSGVISGNSITINGAIGTERGDGIRVYPTDSAATVGNSKISVSNNAIDVNWTGIHLKGVIGYATADVSNNRITSRSVGIYSASRVSQSTFEGNTIYVAATNGCAYAACSMTGCGCIASATSWPLYTKISSNNLSLVDSTAAINALVWLDEATGIVVDNNSTIKTGAVAGTSYHIYAHDCVGTCSISGNSVDNSSVAGTHGIFWDSVSATLTVCGIKNNTVLASNEDGGGIFELRVIAGGGHTNHVYVLGNSLHLTNASGAGKYAEYLLTSGYLFGGDIINVFAVVGAASYVYANSTTNDLIAAPIVDF